jgi:hypothetical protein
MNLGSIYMIQRSKNSPWNGDKVVPHVQRNSRHTSHLARCWDVFWDRILAVAYLEKEATVMAKCTSRQSEAAAGLQMSSQAFKRNLVSSRKCCSSQGSHYVTENGGPSETPGLLT